MAVSVRITKRGDLAADLRRARQRARTLPRTVAREVAAPAGDDVLAGARAERGTLSVSGLNATLDVATSVKGSGRRSTVKLSATPRRAWGVVSGTRKHRIEPTGRRRAVLTPKGPRAAVNHPGTRRRDVWGKSTRRAQPKIDRTVDEAAADAVGDVLGVR